MKHLKWILALLLLTFAGDRIGGYLLNQLLLESQFRYSRLYKGEAGAEILLVGNSRGLSFYQPYMEEMTGLSTFNLSYSAMPMNLADVLVRDYLDRYPAPKYMIIDVTLCDRTNAALISGFNCYRPFSMRMDSLMKAVNPSVRAGGLLSHLFLYNGEIFQRSLYYLRKKDEEWLLDREISNRLKADISSVDSVSVNLVPEMIENLQKTVAFVKSKGIEVRLVVSPYFLPFADRIVNLDEMIAQVEKQTGEQVFDYSRAMGDPGDFGDYQHINVRGSKGYISLLKKDGIIP